MTRNDIASRNARISVATRFPQPAYHVDVRDGDDNSFVACRTSRCTIEDAISWARGFGVAKTAITIDVRANALDALVALGNTP